MTPAGGFAGFYRCFTQGCFGVPGVYSTLMYIQGFPVITVSSISSSTCQHLHPSFHEDSNYPLPPGPRATELSVEYSCLNHLNIWIHMEQRLICPENGFLNMSTNAISHFHLSYSNKPKTQTQTFLEGLYNSYWIHLYPHDNPKSSCASLEVWMGTSTINLCYPVG